MLKKTSPLAIGLSLLLVLSSTHTSHAGVNFTPGQGVIFTTGQGVVLTGAEGVVLTGAEGVVLTGAEGVVLTGAEGVVLTGAEAYTYTGADPEGVVLTGAEQSGLQGFDPELAMILNGLPDTSALNVFVIYYHQPTDSDFADLRGAGVLGGTIFHNLPMVLINATRLQVAMISRLPSVRSIYSNKTTQFFTHDTRGITGQTRILTDPRLTRRNGGNPLSGQSVTVAVLDTGIDATHPDLLYGSEVEQNVRVEDLQGSSPGFVYPTFDEGLQDTDLTMGHGTFVASVIAGSGAASGNYYGGMAPGARLLGICGGDASLFFVLSGMDYILTHHRDQNIRVVNCSFGINGLFDANDPVNIATKLLHDSGISVVFSAGNSGDQPNSLNPYSVAPWVMGIGSGNKHGSLSSFSSRGAAAYGLYHPTLIAPGESIVAARATGVNVVGTAGLAGALQSPQNDLQSIPPAFLTQYTMSSGTSFAAPHVAGTVAMMLQANPSLNPDQIKAILQGTATPMLGYSRYEVGAGFLNAYAAVRQAAFSAPYGAFRSQLSNSSFAISRDAIASFGGEVAPGTAVSVTFNVPVDTVLATVALSWVNPGLADNALSVAVSNGSRPSVPLPPTVLAGQGLKQSGATLTNPPPGAWTITISNPAGGAPGIAQRFNGAIETFQGNYSGLGDIDQMSYADQQSIKLAVATGLVAPQPNGFAPAAAATRLDLARAVMLAAGAQVPQYLPDSPDFGDIPDDASAVFIESVTNSPYGNLLGVVGPSFNPQAQVNRLTMAIATVKALGLDSLAQATSRNPGLSDWSLIPQTARGYVAVAITRNLMGTAGTGYFRPFDSLTRSELAGAAVTLRQASR